MKINYILYTLCLAVLVSACSMELDQTPISEVGDNNFYNDPDDFEQAINGIYNSLRSYPDNRLVLSEIRSDNVYGITVSGIRDYEPINNFAPNISTNEYIQGVWSNNYTGILRANTVLDRINENAVPDTNQRNRMLGEAMFLRAFFYFDLLRTYGSVPLIDFAATPEETNNIPQSNPADLYNFIITDLENAIENLPENYNAVFQGKATNWAAKALLAEVYLTRSGPSFSIEGPGMDSNEYSEAIDLLNDILNNGPFAFVDDYESIFAYNNENNSEIIFDIQYQSGSLGIGATYPGLMVPNGYLLANDIPFPAGGEVKRVSTNLINSYEAEDNRLPFTIQQGFTDQNGNQNPNAFFKKFLDIDNPGTDRFDWPINFPVYRYTHLLMMKAEALLLSGGDQSEIDNLVNQVRSRAGLQPITNVTLAQYLAEERHEFAGEATRWNVLVRTGAVLDVINSWIVEEDTSGDMSSNVDANKIIYAIPSGQINVTQGLYQQNPGYN